MVNPIPLRVRRIWDHWNVRAAVIFSLILQVLLILVAPFRKRTGQKLVIVMIWSAYLLADVVATFAVGLIFNSQGDTTAHSVNPENGDLLAFWAPFLLLHLGGPDTIAAFSLEDNQLWLRHFLALFVQAGTTAYVFVHTLPANRLLAPTVLVFVAGVVKYLERTRSLYLASKEKFRDSLLRKPDPGLDYAKLMDEVASKKVWEILVDNPQVDEGIDAVVAFFDRIQSDDVKLVRKAYFFFQLFKGLIADLPLRFISNEIDKLFSNMGGTEILRMIETELNFFYEVLYTKAAVVHSKWGKLLRFLSVSLVMAAFGVFRFRIKKQGRFDRFDVGITYALLFGALALDVYAFLVALFSDWTLTKSFNVSTELNGRRVASYTACNLIESILTKLLALKRTMIESIFTKFLVLKRPRPQPCQLHQQTALAPPIIFRRGSGLISGHNLIRYCLKCRPKRIIHGNCFLISKVCYPITATINFFGFNKCYGIVFREVIRLLHLSQAMKHLASLPGKLVDLVGLKGVVDEILYASSVPLTKELWEFILDKLRSKLKVIETREQAKEISSARGERVLQNPEWKEDCAEILPYIVGVAYDESLLLWHIATELLYSGKRFHSKDEQCNEREFSKILSDYMLYLLIMRPTMLEAVSSSDQILRFQDTCAEAERFFERKGIRSNQVKKACKEILDVRTDFRPSELKGNKSMSLLFDAKMLAIELEELKEKKWKLLSSVWLELLSYAAINCSGIAHAQQLSKGGELLTFVWLLMAHLGYRK